MSYATTGPALTPPIPGQPAELPIREEGTGNPPARVLIHTELGIPIYFDPASAKFSACVGPVHGKGSQAELHSVDFSVIVERIRLRALVVPVQGYLVSVNHRAETDDAMVEVRPCTVIEHHARRYQPFVVQVTEQGHRSRWDRKESPPPMVARVRSASDVMLPEPAHIERVRAAQKAVLEEERRHETTRQQLLLQVREALAAIPRLTARDLKYVQQSGCQVAQSPEQLGALTYDRLTDDSDEE